MSPVKLIIGDLFRLSIKPSINLLTQIRALKPSFLLLIGFSVMRKDYSNPLGVFKNIFIIKRWRRTYYLATHPLACLIELSNLPFSEELTPNEVKQAWKETNDGFTQQTRLEIIKIFMASICHFKLWATDNNKSEVINFRHSAAHQMRLGPLIKPLQTVVRRDPVLENPLCRSPCTFSDCHQVKKKNWLHFNYWTESEEKRSPLN